MYHPTLLPAVQGKDGNTATTRYRQGLRYTQVYFTVNTSYLQVDNCVKAEQVIAFRYITG